MKPEQAHIQRLISHFGDQTKTAKALRVTQAAVSCWLNGKYSMSAKIATRAERVTGGKFKAEELCPDLAAESLPAA